MEFKHKPVLLEECINGLNIKPNGIYVDGTLGGAGHSKVILEHLSNDGMLIGIDRDEDALKAAKEKLKDYTSAQRYAVYLIKQMGKLHTFNKNDNVIRDSFSNKYEQFQNTSEHTLLNELKNKSMFISMIDTHKSNDLSSICYVVLEELVKTNNNPIKKCQNCGMYFIPNSRLDEIYCDYPKENGKTCREQGAILTYNKRLQEKSAYAEYRKIYQQKFMKVRKNKDNKKIANDFESWKKQAKEKITKLKHEELSEKEVYEWIMKNK